MKKIAILFLFVVSSCVGSRLLSKDHIDVLFRKFVRNDLSHSEAQDLQDIFHIAQAPEHLNEQIFNDWLDLLPTETHPHPPTVQDSSYKNLNGLLQSFGRKVIKSIVCLVCRSAFGALFDLVREGQTDEQAAQALTSLCINLNIADESVCRGAVALNIPIMTYTVRTKPLATPEAFCALILQSASEEGSNNCPLTDARFEWEVELPPVPQDIIQPIQVNSTTPLKIAILTDVHIDPLYEAYGVADCSEPLCCRKGQTQARQKIISSNIDESVFQRSLINETGQVALDLDVGREIGELRQSTRRIITARNSEPAGYWGDYRSCDTPIWAYDDVVDTIIENHDNIDLVYYIGDTIDHGIWETSYELINEMNSYLVDKLRRAFGDDIPVVLAIGNHEAQPTNQFAPPDVTGNLLNTTWLYDELANKWAYYLTEEAQTTMRDHGGYSILVKPGFRVISINNNVAYKMNWWLVYDPEEPKRHLQFLIDELYKAELAGESVHIVQHIPPGVHDLIYTWTREYNRIVNRFSATIKGEFNGHTHADEFKVFYDDNRQPINIAWGAGGATAYANYNLNYKIATFDQSTFEPINILNYVYNLTEANTKPNRRPHWFQLYDLKQRFDLPDLTPSSVNDLVYSMVTTQKPLLDMYAAFSSKLSDPRWLYCGTECKLDTICRTVVTVLWDREICNELRQEYYYSST